MLCKYHFNQVLIYTVLGDLEQAVTVKSVLVDLEFESKFEFVMNVKKLLKM